MDPEAQGQQHQELEYNDGVVVTDSQEASNFDYTGVPVAATGTADTGDVDAGASNPNENKWNKNGFGQGKQLLGRVRVRVGVQYRQHFKLRTENRSDDSNFSHDSSFPFLST